MDWTLYRRQQNDTDIFFDFSENKKDHHLIRATTTTTASQRPMPTLLRHQDHPHCRIWLSSDPPRHPRQRRLTSTTTPISPPSAGPRLSASTGNLSSWCPPTKKPPPPPPSSHCPSRHPSPDGMPPLLVTPTLVILVTWWYELTSRTECHRLVPFTRTLIETALTGASRRHYLQQLHSSMSNRLITMWCLLLNARGQSLEVNRSPSVQARVTLVMAAAAIILLAGRVVGARCPQLPSTITQTPCEWVKWLQLGQASLVGQPWWWTQTLGLAAWWTPLLRITLSTSNLLITRPIDISSVKCLSLGNEFDCQSEC